MEEKKKPKYKVGDTVVITMYGTVGKITAVKWLDGTYVYEINNSQGLFTEESLDLLTNVDHHETPVETEEVHIEYRFFIGDLVQVYGYGSDLFKVVGFRTEIWRYKEDAWEDIIYELSRIGDGQWLEASEDELILVADAENANAFLQKLGLLSLVYKKHDLHRQKPEPRYSFRARERQILQEKEEFNRMVDGLLDIYNDYRILYEMFGDNEYKKIMEVVMTKLKSIVNGRKLP